jgi:hypothetical protein
LSMMVVLLEFESQGHNSPVPLQILDVEKLKCKSIQQLRMLIMQPLKIHI